VIFLEPLGGGGIAGFQGLEEFFGLLPELLQIGPRGQ
jgi:hypothetical protein